jgi:GH35 family endo-1,4-beta-xylanase
VCTRYGKRIYSYDVVNEAVQPETGAIRETNVTRALGGEAFLDLMFHTARQAAPHAQLVYNDYMSWERTAEDETHIKGVLKLLEGFKKRGTPVDALGVQSHIRLLKKAPVAEIVRESEGPWRRFLDEVVGMGYQLLITEFDVNDHDAPTAIVPRDRIVADYGKAYLDLMLGYPQLQDVLCWGMCDRYSWLDGFDPRADKTLDPANMPTRFSRASIRTPASSASDGIIISSTRRSRGSRACRSSIAETSSTGRRSAMRSTVRASSILPRRTWASASTRPTSASTTAPSTSSTPVSAAGAIS